MKILKVVVMLMLLVGIVTPLCANFTIGNWRWRNDDGGEADATWRASENTSIYLDDNDNVRVRLEYGYTDVSGSMPTFGIPTKLEYSIDGTGTFSTLQNEGTHFIMSLSENFTYKTVTTDQLSDHTDFSPGYMYDEEINEGFDFNFYFDEDMQYEFEYCMQKTDNAYAGVTYIFRMPPGPNPSSTTYGYPNLTTPPATISFTDGSSYSTSPLVGESDQPIGRFMLSADIENSFLHSVSILLNGTRTGASNFKLWESADDTFDSGVDTQRGSTITTDPGEGEVITFTPTDYTSEIATSGVYYFLTCDVASVATGVIEPKIVNNDSFEFSGTNALTGSISSAPLSNGPVSLPVTLSTFTADFINNTPTLYWETQSEIDNIGWNIYRNNDKEFSTSMLLTDEMLSGHGTTTEPSYYHFEDGDELEIGQTYYYWLESVDYGGISKVYSKVAQITIPDPSTNPPQITRPIVCDCKNVPNPVNGNTEFQFTLDSAGMVSVSIYNIKGALVKTLPSVLAQPDETLQIYWNGKDGRGNDLTPGVYFYNLIVNGNVESTQKLILMK